MLNSEFIKKWLHENFDIIFISETHLTKGQSFNFHDYIPFHNAFTSPNKSHPRGGVSCFIKPSHMRLIKKITMDITDQIYVELKNGHIVFCTYIAPTDSPYFDITDFCKIANIFTSHNRAVFGGGDINSCVGNIKMKLSAGMSYRPNPDNTVNDHGKEITKICKSFNCFIVNNCLEL